LAASGDALIREAFDAIQAGDWPRASSIAARALAVAPRSAEAHYLTALIARNAGRLEEAIAGLERAVSLRPAFFEAWAEPRHRIPRGGRFGKGARLLCKGPSPERFARAAAQQHRQRAPVAAARPRQSRPIAAR
jgi:tetratricopeptide (TPR) repeat protein